MKKAIPENLEWRDIPTWEGLYKINRAGEIYSYKTGIYLKGQKTVRGYLIVQLRSKERLITKSRHRLIAEIFLPNPLNHPIINHKNGVKTDNRIENLEWCTHRHNVRHALETGLTKVKVGEELVWSKLTEQQIWEIRLCWTSINKMAAHYGVALSAISFIVNRKRWKHLP